MVLAMKFKYLICFKTFIEVHVTYTVSQLFGVTGFEMSELQLITVNNWTLGLESTTSPLGYQSIPSYHWLVKIVENMYWGGGSLVTGRLLCLLLPVLQGSIFFRFCE